MNKIVKSVVLFLAVCVSMNVSVVFAQMKEINFGIISTESSSNLRTLWEPFLNDMSAKTGIKVNAYFVTDYAAVIEGMKFNKVHIAWYGNKSAMEAVDRADGEVFAQTVNADGTDGYYSHIVAQSSSSLNNINDMIKNAKSLTFSNGDPNSTSGFLVPSYYVFAMNKVEANKIFKRTVSGSHESNLLTVANKQVDVATANSEAITRLKTTYPDKVANIKVIWTSPLIPSDPLVWRKDLDAKTKAAIDEFIFSYGDNDKELEVLKALGWAKFKRSTNAQLSPIRQLELFKQKTKVENDGKMSAGEKKQAIAEIDKKLKELQ